MPVTQSPYPAARGVYSAPFLSEEGGAVIVAIDSTGRLRAQVAVPPNAPDGSIAAQVEQLRTQLNAMDPEVRS